MCVYMYVCILYIYMCVHMYTYISLHTCVYMYVYTCTYIYIYIHIHGEKKKFLPVMSVAIQWFRDFKNAETIQEIINKKFEHLCPKKICIFPPPITAQIQRRLRIYSHVRTNTKKKLRNVMWCDVTARKDSWYPAGVEPIHWNPADIDRGSLNVGTNWKVS